MAQNPHADEVFEVLSEIISFDSAAIFYLSLNSLTLEFGKILNDLRIFQLKTDCIQKSINIMMIYPPILNRFWMSSLKL